MRSDGGGGSRSIFHSYAVCTFVPSAAATGLAGALGQYEVAWGVGVAWAVQAVAFRRLAVALEAGRRATTPWMGGMMVRFGVLAVLGAVTYVGPAGKDLPVAYGISMLVLLLAEAGWLALGRPGVTGDNRLDRTRSTE